MWQTGLRLAKRLQEAGFIAYFAGGCVRDRLLGQESHDIDIATTATPEEVQRLFPQATGLHGRVFGVVRVPSADCSFEVATFRRDIGTRDGRHPDHVVFARPAEDACRRDFTINALFFDPVAERLIDYVGGQVDLVEKRIRAVGNPSQRFREDKLRLLRAIRFAANLGFSIEQETWHALQDQAATISLVSIERVRDELDRIWSGAAPALGLDLLDRSGLLAQILPEVSALHGVEQPKEFHPEGDVFVHTRLLLERLHHAPLSLAWSALLHDIGKPVTGRTDPSGRIRFFEHEVVGARIAHAILSRLRQPNALIEDVVAMVANHMTFKDAKQMRPATLKRLLARATFPLELELHRIDCLACHGDLSIYEFLRTQLEELPPSDISPPRLLTGHDLIDLGLSPGPRLGSLLGAVREAQLNGQICTREQALALAELLIRSSPKPPRPDRDPTKPL
ncbi:CCA tRNA nucleotidyltransferase [Methylacidimicrobium tartarophylax]|uniref:CCA-adding enzyme n=1 Tax=Methylacidimicrobium tartarophylax TaxID=1041768 RepID=A0A5E6MFS6_9BACT|nr:CCA tRNA nucleotidyltransferase [Methylacidimicrobium tartarophylax]VVM04390.1 CCA-adding enzyme [Methylacidimicrobium tartarophylax]